MKQVVRQLTRSILGTLTVMSLLAGCSGNYHVDVNSNADSVNNDMDSYSDSNVSDALDQNSNNSDVSTEIDRKLELIESETLQYPGKKDGYTYNAYESYVEIKGYPSGETSLDIPATIDGLPVWVIGDNMASESKSLESVTIPDTVVKIGEFAFYYAKNLKSVSLPDSVAIIEHGAFFGTAIPEVPISSNIREIADQAFPHQYRNHSITIPESAQYIGFQDFCFYDWQEGETITITILSRDVELSDEFYVSEAFDSDGNRHIWDVVIRGYAGSTAAEYCAEHHVTMEVIPE